MPLDISTIVPEEHFLPGDLVASKVVEVVLDEIPSQSLHKQLQLELIGLVLPIIQRKDTLEQQLAKKKK